MMNWFAGKQLHGEKATFNRGLIQCKGLFILWCLPSKEVRLVKYADMEHPSLPITVYIQCIFPFKLYRQIEFCAFQPIMKACLEEEEEEEGVGEELFFFDSWIVNHINLLSYRHTGVWCDLCGFSCMWLCQTTTLYVLRGFILGAF